MLSLLLACTPPALDTGDPSPPVDAVAVVDPFIGTGGVGFLVGSSTPAATVPFGMVKLGPDTALDWGAFDPYHCAGYYWDDTHVDGFSHTHMHGTGVPDYGNILVMPLDGMDPSYTDPDAWRTAFSHDDEQAAVGYYAVTLGNGISAELTASARVGVHRYAWPATADPVLVFDLEHVLGGVSYGGEVHVDAAAGTVSGWMINAGGFTGQGFPVYFHAEVEDGFATFGTWADDAPTECRADAAGVDLGVWLRATGPTLELRVGISPVSVDNARANLAEVEGKSFETVVAEAQEAWAEPLSRFEITGADEAELRIFYTAVYHLLQMPTNWTDGDGRYAGFDGAVHTAGATPFYSDFSMWDTYRTAHPAYTLFYPSYASAFATSLLTMAQQGGAFPRWPAANGEGGSMLGAPANIVLADTWLKGVQDWDVAAAWTILDAQARGEIEVAYNQRPDPALQIRYGYLPADLVGGSVAWNQELAWADDAMAGLANALGHTEDAAFYEWRSYTYRNQYDPAVGFFHARSSDGTFSDDLNPLAWEDEYTEGNAWQYLWMPPAHADATATLFGGEAVARERLTTFMQGAVDEGLVPTPATYYWHGNEPDIHAPFLFALWGDPDATGLWQRWVEDNRYADTPDGLAGNDDAGTLSAWYLFSTLGFYPIAGTDQYVIGVPRWPEARFKVGDGWFSVARVGSGAHVSRVSLDGVTLTRPVLHHAELAAGSVLTVELTE